MKRKILAMLLSMCLLLGMIPTTVMAEETPNETRPKVVFTAYSDEAIVIDGAISDQGWQIHDLGNGLSIGAQWQKKNLLLAIGGQVVALNVNGKEVPLTGTEDVTVSEGGDYKELSLSMAWLGLLTESKRPEIGDEINVFVTDGELTVAVTLRLGGVDWYAVENPLTALTAKSFSEQKTNQGTVKVIGGYEMFDLYDAAEDATNAANTRTYMVYQQGPFASLLHEHDQPIYVEFDFCADALPDFGSDPRIKDNKLYPNYGFSLVIADAYDDPANGNYWSTMIRVGLCNIDGQIHFVSYLNNGQYNYAPLGKTVGEAFRLGISWEMDGSVVVSVDGTEAARIAGVETSLHWYASECISFNLMRGNAATSSADDMRVSITNLAAGKSYDPYTIPTVVVETPIGAEYVKTAVSLDGKLDESKWKLDNTITDDEAVYTGKFGVQWDDENLYLAVETAEKKVAVEFGKTVITVDMEQGIVSGVSNGKTIPTASLKAAVSGDAVELAIPMRILDVIRAEAGQTIPVIVRTGEAALQGELVLIKDKTVAWETVVADVTAIAGQPNDYYPKNLNAGRQASVANNTGDNAVPGAKVYTLQQKYTEGVVTTGKDYAYLRIQNNDTALAALNEAAVDKYVEMKLHIEKLPVISNAPTTWSSFACYGLSWDIHGNGKSIVMGVINTASGLQLAVRKPTGTHTIVPLNQQEGSTFRIGIQWHVDDTLAIYVDDVLVTQTPITGATFTDPAPAAIKFNLVRPDNFLTSSDSDMKVHISEIALKKETEAQEESAPVATPTVIETAYTAESITLDGEITEQGWLMNNSVGSGKFGVQWDTENLYFAVDTNGEALSLSVGGKTVALNDTNSKAQSVTEVQLSLEDLGITVYDYGTQVPISVTLGDATVNKTLKLIAGDWFVVEKADAPITANKQGSTGTGVTNLQGFEKIDGGYRMYDLWDPAGENPTGIRTYLMKIGTSYNSSGVATNEGDVRWNPLGEHQSNWMSFDFRADSMPVYSAADMAGLSATYPCYGLSVFMADGYNKYPTYAGHNLVAFGIFNSVDGLMLTVTSNSGAPVTVPMGKQVGDAFRISAVWMWDEIRFEEGAGKLIIYVDGAHLVTVEDAQFSSGYITRADGVLGFNLIRSKEAAKSVADDLDISITNLAAGKLDVLSLMDKLDWNMIKGSNTDPNNITENMELPKQLTDGVLSTGLSWTADPEGVIADDGTVTIPDNLGKPVTLTAKLAGTNAEKTFQVIVPGTGAYDGKVTVVSRDQNPADGFGEGFMGHRFTLDENNNSIVLDLEETKDINQVTLTDGDAFARLRRDNLTLWYYSESTEQFVQIKDFKLKHDGTNWYLYGFSVNTRYIKVHSTHYDGTEADFVNALESMIDACWDASFEAVDAQTVPVPITTLKDQAAQITLPEGITASNLRVALNGKLLYHYAEDEKVFVQIPEPNTAGNLTVWNGEADDIELSNKEYVYEVSYGVREAWAVTDTHWIQTLNNGTTVGVVVDKSAGYDQYAISYSYDGGLTWSDYKLLDVANEGATETQGKYITGAGNFIYDTHTGRLILHGHQSYDIKQETDASGNTKVSYKLRTNFIASDDNGVTWYKLGTMESDYDYLVSYAAGLELSCYDGEGPNVDFVFSLATWHPERTDGTMCTLVAYSTDAGTTWKVSDDYIATERSTNNASGNNSEGGASEATIMESDDGTLVLYTRYQADNQMHFAVSYSFDHGITWKTGAELEESNVYTSNTQPMFYRYDGAPLLVWGGNNAVDRDGQHTVGNSYIRTPMSVAVTYDGGDTFGNIQDLYAGYSMQGLTFTTQHCIINPMVQKGGEDSLLICYWDQFNNRTVEKTMLLRVDDFTDYFYRNKGAYDSFEHGTVKYEGWDVVAGSAEVSSEQHYDGTYAMKLQGATAVRSIPYMQSGTISLQVYPTSSADMTISLQSAYSNVTDRSAPVNVVIPGNVLVLNQWNTVQIQLDLTGDNFYVTATAAGNSVTPQMNATTGDYICFITVFVGGTIYVDDVLVTEDQDAEIYKQSAEGAVMQKIASIGTITLGSEERINAARAAYNALTEKQKAKVTNLKDLEDAEVALDALIETKLAYATIVLEDYISIGWHLRLNSEIVDDDTAYVEFEQNGKTIQVKDRIERVIGGKKYYVYYFNVAAKEMADEITATLVSNNGTVEMELGSYSVVKYAEAVIESDDYVTYPQSLRDLLKAMLSYGADAQTYFSYNPGDLADKKHSTSATFEEADMSILREEHKADSSKQKETVKFYGSSLVLKANTTLRFIFEAQEGISFTVKDAAGKKLTASKNGQYYYVDITGIAAKDLDGRITLTIHDGTDEWTVSSSPLTYCYNVLAREGSYRVELVNLVKSLYLYNKAADNYWKE